MKNINNIDDVLRFLTKVGLDNNKIIRTAAGGNSDLVMNGQNTQTMKEVIEWMMKEYQRPKVVYLVYSISPFSNEAPGLRHVCETLESARMHEEKYKGWQSTFIEVFEVEDAE